MAEETGETGAVLDSAAAVMAEATSGFVQESYGREGLDALAAAGWSILPPTRPHDAAHPKPMGWIVLTRQGDTESWRDDWDGEFHIALSEALRADAEAKAAIGAKNVRLVACMLPADIGGPT